MARGFRHLGSGYVAELDPAEARLVITLARDVLQMLSNRDGAPLIEVPQPRGGRFEKLADWGIEADGAPGRHRATRRERRRRHGSLAVPDAVSEPERESSGAAEDLPGEPEPAEDRWWEALGLVDPTEETQADEPAPRRRAPQDPALARLLPDLIADADAEDGEAERLRALTEDGIVASKRSGLEEAVRLLAVDPLRIPEAEAPRFGAALNDIRLVLAERLGIHTEEDARRVTEDGDTDEVSHFMAVLYSFVSWLQESLMTALLKRR